MLAIYKRLLFPIYLPSLISSSVHTATLILLPLYLLETGYGMATASFAVAIRGLGVILADLPAGLIANRFGDKTAILVGSICLLVAVFMLTFFDSLIAIYIASVFLGSSNSMNMIGRLSYISDVTESHERGRAISIMAGLQRGGSLAGPLAFSLIASTFTFNTSFSIMLILAFFNIIAVSIFAERLAARHRKESPPSAMLQVIIDFRKILLTAGYAGLTLMMLRSARSLLISLFGYQYGLDVAQIGVLYSLCAAVDMSLFYPAGIIMDRWGRKWTAIPGSLIFSLALILLPMIPSYTGLLMFAILSGVGNGMTSGVLLTIGSDLAPVNERNHFLGLWRLQNDIGTVFSPLLVGMLAESLSLLFASWAIAGFGLSGVTVLGLFVKETLIKETRASPDP